MFRMYRTAFPDLRMEAEDTLVSDKVVARVRATGTHQGEFIAMPATAKNGTRSRIVPMLDPGAGVVTSRGSVHYVVTEFGVAYLHGRTIRQRAEALISIAHPKFREELFQYCEKTRWLQRPALQER